MISKIERVIRITLYVLSFSLVGFMGYLISGVASKKSPEYFLSKTDYPTHSITSSFIKDVHADTPIVDPGPDPAPGDDGGDDGGCP